MITIKLISNQYNEKYSKKIKLERKNDIRNIIKKSEGRKESIMTERNDKENTNEEMRGKCNTESKERGKGRDGTGRKQK